MHQQKNKKIFIYIFLFFIIGTFNNKNLTDKYLFRIENIYVTGLDEKSNNNLIDDLTFLKINNLFFLNKFEISEIISSNNQIEKFTVFKKYPSSLNINVEKTKVLANLKKDGEFFSLGSNGKLIKIKNLKKNIPFIFGDFNNRNFFELKKNIEKTNFSYKNIKNLFFFQSGRWDIETHSGILIKLPRKEIKRSLEISIKIINENQFKKMNKIDLRQLNQIIIDGQKS